MFAKFIVTFLLICNIINGQIFQKSSLEIELFMLIENSSSSKKIFFTLDSVQDSVLENDSNRFIFNKTTDIKYTFSKYPKNAPTSYIDSNSTFPNYMKWGGFDFVSGSEEILPNDYGDFAYGLYSLTPYEIVVQNNQQFEVELGGKFYLDMRDSHYPHIIGFTDYPGNDFFIKYDVVDEKFYHSGFNSPSDFSDLNNEITENDIISIWELANLTKPDNSLFPIEFWQNCLVLLDYGNHPHLVWGAHPTMSNITGYKLYRAVMDQQANPNTGNYQLIYTSPNNQVFDYTDNEVNLGYDDNYIYYYVKAFNSSGSSERSNYVGTEGEFLPYKSISNQRNEIDIISLNNYPNPFNPTTTISYSIANSSIVNITVYDLLGRKIAELINEKKEDRYL